MAVIVGPTPTYETYIQGFYATAGLLLIAIFLSFAMKAPKTSEPA